MGGLFERDKVKEEFPTRGAIIRSGGHRHLVVDIDELLAALGGGGPTSGGVPVVDGATGRVVTTAVPDPVHGGYTYVDPRVTVVEESSGSGRSVAAGGGISVRAVIDTPSPTTAPADIGGGGLGPPPGVEEVPVTRPRCTGADCFLKVGCHPGSASGTRINPQPLYGPTNLGSTPLTVIFAGPMKPNGKRDVIQEVQIGPGITGPNLIPPAGTDTIFLGCGDSGSVTFRYSPGVAFD